MFISLIICAASGVLLGLRFKVLVLVPATLLIVVAVVLASAAIALPLSTIAFTTIGSVVSLQAGYAAAAIMQIAIFTRRPARSTTRFHRAGYGTDRHVEYLNT